MSQDQKQKIMNLQLKDKKIQRLFNNKKVSQKD